MVRMEDQATRRAFGVERAAVPASAADVGHHRPRPLLALALLPQLGEALFQAQQVGRQALALGAALRRALFDLGQLLLAASESLPRLLQVFGLLRAALNQPGFLLLSLAQGTERRLEAGANTLILGPQLLFLRQEPADLLAVILQTSKPMLFLLPTKLGGLLSLFFFRPCPGFLDSVAGSETSPTIKDHQHQDKRAHGAEQDRQERERVRSQVVSSTHGKGPLRAQGEAAGG
jgi:hypothetical protein